MGKIKSTDEPVGRMAKLMAALYYFMAREMLDQLGEENGVAAIRNAIQHFGQVRVAAMQEEAAELGLKISTDTYALVRDMPGISWETSTENPADITYCPMQDMWHQLGGNALGKLYCEIDSILYDSFNAVIERPLCKTHGDSCCRFIIKPKDSASASL